MLVEFGVGVVIIPLILEDLGNLVLQHCLALAVPSGSTNDFEDVVLIVDVWLKLTFSEVLLNIHESPRD